MRADNSTPISDDFQTISRNFLKIFYIVDVEEAKPENMEVTQNFFQMMGPSILSMIIIEQLMCYVTNKKLVDGKHFSINASHFALMFIFRPLHILLQKTLLLYIYHKYGYSLVTSDATSLFVASFLIMDFLHYIGHRLEHSTRLFWSIHCVHHSIDAFDISVSLRMSVFHNVVIIPLSIIPALFIHPSYLIFHEQAILIYQMWIHANSIGNLGIIDYIFNTPSNHRVHHDNSHRSESKNFGACLMLWDHMFRTYKREEKPIDFEVHLPETVHRPIKQQFAPLLEVCQGAHKTPGFLNKLHFLFQSPMDEDVAKSEVVNQIKSEKEESDFCNIWEHCLIYGLVQWLLMFVLLFEHFPTSMNYQSPANWITTLSAIWLLTATDTMLSFSKYTYLIEDIRCIIMVIAVNTIPDYEKDDARYIYTGVQILAIFGLTLGHFLKIPLLKNRNPMEN